VFCDRDIIINPGIIVNHNWKELRAMWKTVNADYKAALTIVLRFQVPMTVTSSVSVMGN
jgi:hypothetical protein